jgi:hypothetical protein
MAALGGLVKVVDEQVFSFRELGRLSLANWQRKYSKKEMKGNNLGGGR